jgi:glycosyltransferase involved in cell wall biosynthesis
MKSAVFKGKVLIIGYVWPETNASAAGLRDWALMQHFREAGCEVTYASPAKENDFSAALRDLGLRTFSCQANDPQFDVFLRELAPELVIFDRFVTEEQFGWRVEDIAPNALRIVDTQDLHCLRRAREAALKKLGFPLPEANLSFLRKYADEDFLREMSSIIRSDQAFVLSSYERDFLISIGIPEQQITLLRFSYSDRPGKLPGFHERKSFVSIGNFRHPPNFDAVLWMKSEIWPRLRALTGNQAELHIYGAYPLKEMMALDDKASGFRVLGAAKNQYETLSQYRVLLAPLRFGAGIKGKIADSWWSGTAVATTTIGAEGMADCGETLRSENAPDNLAQLAYSLWSDERLWSEEREKGFRILDSEYSQAKNQKLLIDRITLLKTGLTEQRGKNWQGAVLQLNHLRSTKYMSKWIEAKNQLPAR